MHGSVPGKRLGTDPTIRPSATVCDGRLGAWTDVSERSKGIETVLDDYSYVANDSDIIYSEIGKFVNIAAHVRVNSGQHPVDKARQHHFQYRSSAYDMGDDAEKFFDWRRSTCVAIGHDTWIGHGAIIKGGLSIGTGAVIGSASMVTKDVSAYTIVAGNPALPLRSRSTKPGQEAMLRIKWWNWTHEQIGERLTAFRSLSAAAFCLKYGPVV